MVNQLPPPEEWGSTPAGLPPPGVPCCNFENPETRGPLLVIVCSVLLVFMLFFWSARLYARHCIVHKLTWADWTCSLAAFLSLAIFPVQVWGVTAGPVGKHIWDVSLAAVTSDMVLKGVFFSLGLLVTFAIFLARLSFFIMYYELFKPMRWMRIAVCVGVTAHTISLIVQLIANLIIQVPRPGETWLQHNLYNEGAGAQPYIAVASSVAGLATDLYLLVLPLVAVWKTQLDKAKKIGITITFMTGSLAVLCSVLSVWFRVPSDRPSDVTWDILTVSLLTLTELFIGIIVSCMPSFLKVLQTRFAIFDRLRGSFYRRVKTLGAGFGSSRSASDRRARSAKSPASPSSRRGFWPGAVREETSTIDMAPVQWAFGKGRGIDGSAGLQVRHVEMHPHDEESGSFQGMAQPGTVETSVSTGSPTLAGSTDGVFVVNQVNQQWHGEQEGSRHNSPWV